jgi:hypothetical protein
VLAWLRLQPSMQHARVHVATAPLPVMNEAASLCASLDETVRPLPAPEVTCQEYHCPEPTCTCTFANKGVLGRHMADTGHGSNLESMCDIIGISAKMSTRKSYTWETKRDILLKIDACRANPTIPFPQTTISKAMKVSKSMLSKWEKQREHIFAQANHGDGGGQRAHRESIGQFPAAEDILYGRFIKTRFLDRMPVNHDWLRDEMRDIVHRLNPDQKPAPTVAAFTASVGWCIGFNERWGNSSQSRTNKHVEHVQSRLHKVANFHRWLIYDMQARLPQRCVKYGRFPPSHMFHVDQIPLPMCSPTQRTMNPINSQCEVKQPGGSALSKRYATLQLCICAQPDRQVVKLELYFRGKGTGLKQAELDELSKFDNLIIRFQPNAWASEKIIIDSLIAFRTATLDLGEVLLGMDGHTSQITPFCRAMMDHLGIRYAITTPNCTDIISPVDRHVGAALKAKIFARYNEALKANKNMWSLPAAQGGLSDPRKRMLLATWSSEAWREMCNENHHLIRQSFVETGFLLAKDGSENHLVRPYKRPKLDIKKPRAKAGQATEKKLPSYSNVSPLGVAYDFGPPDKESRKRKHA